MYWWATGSGLTFFILIPIFIGSACISDLAFGDVYQEPANYIRGEVFWVGLLGLVAFGVSALLMERSPANIKLPRFTVPAYPMGIVIYILFSITTLCYALYLYPIVLQPSIIVGVLKGTIIPGEGTTRLILGRIPGVTSFMSLQSVFITCIASYTRFTGERLPRRYIYMTVLIGIFAGLRAWLWPERMALIEFFFPLGVITCANIKGYRKLWLVFAPFTGFFILFCIFSAGEYFRSWQAVKFTTEYDFFEYMFIRLVGYYATALNNGASMTAYLDPTYTPINTAAWFYRLPLWSLLDIDLIGNRFLLDDYLNEFGNPEFNNGSGLYVPYLDFGDVLGTILWCLLGLFSGRLAKLYKLNLLEGRILYPVWFVGIPEISRIFYWGDPRFFPIVFFGTFAVIMYLKQFVKYYR